MVRTNASSNRKLELLRFGEALCSEIAGMESVNEECLLAYVVVEELEWKRVRSSDDDLGVYEFLIEF